jgi:hypothetical protein
MTERKEVVVAVLEDSSRLPKLPPRKFVLQKSNSFLVDRLAAGANVSAERVSGRFRLRVALLQWRRHNDHKFE